MSRIANQKLLGRKIRKLRQRKNLRREAFGEMCGIKAVKMWKIESGEVNPSLSTLVRLSKELDTNLASLLKGIR